MLRPFYFHVEFCINEFKTGDMNENFNERTAG